MEEPYHHRSLSRPRDTSYWPAGRSKNTFSVCYANLSRSVVWCGKIWAITQVTSKYALSEQLQFLNTSQGISVRQTSNLHVRYHEFLNGFHERSTSLYLADKKGIAMWLHGDDDLGSNFTIGYDLLSKGMNSAHESVLNLFQPHYGPFFLFSLKIIPHRFLPQTNVSTCPKFRYHLWRNERIKRSC